MKRLITGIIVVVVAALLFAAWWETSLAPVNKNDTQLRQFIITKGDGVREVAKQLRDQGLIRNQVALFLLIKQLGIEKNIQAGSFQLSPSMTARQLAQKLTIGTEDVWLTLPEGWRCEQVLEYLGGINTNWQQSPSSTASACGTIFQEGKIFPETYLVPRNMSLDRLGNLTRQMFEEKTNKLKVDTKTLVLASLIEREAKKENDRPLVASVLQNRLDAGMALDVDATIQYVLGKSGNWWPREISLDDLKIKSLYNTYLNPGLPPAPICSPGLSSIKAAQNPAQTDYLFYLSDKSGNMHYAKSLSEHNQNVAKYLN